MPVYAVGPIKRAAADVVEGIVSQAVACLSGLPAACKSLCINVSDLSSFPLFPASGLLRV
jgi:hypothetical protein